MRYYVAVFAADPKHPGGEIHRTLVVAAKSEEDAEDRAMRSREWEGADVIGQVPREVSTRALADRGYTIVA